MTKETQMGRHYNDFLNSGLSRKHYCEKHSINLSTFKYWHGKLESKPKSSFVSVEIPSKIQAVTFKALLEIEYPNGVKIKSICDFEIIRKLISLV